MLAFVLFFGALELLFWSFGSEPPPYEDDPYVGFSTINPHYVEQRADDGSLVVETAANKLRLFHRQRFRPHKPAGTFRIFCLGGSTTYGRPFGDSTSFCGWLRQLLPVADPSKQWEVINAGGISYASYRVALLTEELSDYQPDLFIVYTGHNEFLEQRTYGSIKAVPRALLGLSALAEQSRFFTAAKHSFESWQRSSSVRSSPAERVMLEPEVRTLLDNSVGPDQYHRDDSLRARIANHFHHSLVRIIEISRSVDANTLLIRPASNLRDCTPFKSSPSTEVDDRQNKQRERLTSKVREALESGEHQQASTWIDTALAIDDRVAELHYLHAKILEASGDDTAARKAYERARDEDICPLRAPREIAPLVEQVAAQWQTPFVDFSKLVDQHAVGSIPGRDLFLDHVHPTIEGNRLLALAIIDEMVKHHIIDLDSNWGPTTISAVRRRIEGSIDRTSQGRALSNLSRVLGWAGKLEEALDLAIEATRLAPHLAVVQHQAALCAHLTGDLEQAETHYRKTIQLEPTNATAHSNLAVILDEDGRDSEAAAHYRQAISLLGDRNAEYRSRLRDALAKIEKSR